MEEKTHTTFGKISLILGMLSILLIISQVIAVYGVYIGAIGSNLAIVLSFFGYLSIPSAIIAVILGYLARKQGDKYGTIGLILGLIVIILFIISLVMSAVVYFYAANMIPDSSTNRAMLFLDMHQIAPTSNGWVNWTIDTASNIGSTEVKWSDLKITVGGVNFGAPTETMQPAIGHCGYSGVLGEGGKLYVHGTTEQITAGLSLIVSYEVSYKTPTSSGTSKGMPFHETIE